VPGASAAGPKAFVPGVRIDWKERVVEVDGEIVLRKGPLELFACAPRSKEHESIVVVRPRPLHIFQAMGLLGMEPGAPARYDDQAGKWLAPHGDPLDLRVRYRKDAADHVVAIEDWLLDVEHQRPPGNVRWVFAGSRFFDEGEFGADEEGTVICVVDFDTALITVSALHSADNSELWLAARTEQIPPVGTAVTLLIRSRAPPPIELELTQDGTWRSNGQPFPAEQVARAAADVPPGGEPRPIVLRCPGDVPPKAVDAVVQQLVRAGIDRARIRDRCAAPAPAVPPARP
jgi:biopolymer transport protein ExbD